MKKAIILLLIVSGLLVIAVVAYHKHKHNILNQLNNAEGNTARLTEFGLVQGITPQEFQDATNVLVSERRMWSRFSGMSGSMSVDFVGNDGKSLSLVGDVSLRRIDLSPDESGKFLARYTMTISDKLRDWTVTTDGTSSNTVISCQNPQVSEVIKTINPASLLHLLTFPLYETGALYRDRLYPPNLVNPYTINEFLWKYRPWLTTNALPHSYIFIDIDGNRHHEIGFENGHLSLWRRLIEWPGAPVVEKLAVHFENPVESQGFWYPTVIRITPAPTPWPYPRMEEGWLAPIVDPQPAGHGQLRITLTDVSVSIK
ncbi:MAG: hypothetical protein ABSC89_07000 [Verrucomicrobiota bacterium]|jgi:hypothetical protein